MQCNFETTDTLHQLKNNLELVNVVQLTNFHLQQKNNAITVYSIVAKLAHCKMQKILYVGTKIVVNNLGVFQHSIDTKEPQSTLLVMRDY